MLASQASEALRADLQGRERAAAAPSVVCFPFAGGLAGGSHVSACKLIKSLDRAEFTPLVVLHSDSGQVRELLRCEGIAYCLAPVAYHFGQVSGAPRGHRIKVLARSLAGQVALARFLRRSGVRIVHTNEGAMHLSWWLPAKVAGAKLLWHHRNEPTTRGVRFLAPVVADQVVSVSHFALSLARPALTEAKTSVVYSPFDTEHASVDRIAARQELLRELAIPPDTRVLSWFGNLIPRKRPMLFLEVIAEMRRRAPSLRIRGLIFGVSADGGMEAELARTAESLGITDVIRLMGHRYPSDRWMAGSDIHVVTAIDEPFGRTIIEAMLLGTPVIASRCGGNIEAIEHGQTGLLAPRDDVGAMAKMTLELLERPKEMSRMAAEARAAAMSKFGVETHRRSITELYRKLL